MNCLVDIKALLEQHNFKRIISEGWRLTCQGDRWTIAHDVVYLNGEPITKKQILQYMKDGPRVMPPRITKMITPKEGYENDSSSIETNDE